MKQVKAYACPVCEEIYKTEAQAVKCEDSCKQAKIEQEEQELLESRMEDLINYVRLNAESVEDICNMSIEISKKLNKNQYIQKMSLRVKYVEHASNSHSAPINNQTNWERKADKPTGYPALYGDISFTYNKAGKLSGSDIFSRWHKGIVGVNTGSGGARDGKNAYGYDVTLWLDDFPKIKEKIEKLHEEIEQFSNFEMDIHKQYSDMLKEDVELKTKKAEIEVLDKEILVLQAKCDVIKTEAYQIEQKHKTPLKEVLDTKAKELDNEFGIRVYRSF